MINLFLLNSSIDEIGKYAGQQHWVYYLIGAIFFVLSIVTIFFSFKWRHSKSKYENYNYPINEFVKFWHMNKFAFMVMLSLILIICGIVFMLMNPLLLKQ